MMLDTALSTRFEKLLATADYTDVHTVDASVSLRAFVAAALSWKSPWIRGLLRLVHGAALPSNRLRAEALSFRPGDKIRLFTVVEAVEERYLLLEAADTQLTAYLAFIVEPGSRGHRTFKVMTLVTYNSWTGPLYFNLIRPGHLLVLGSMVRAGARA